MSPQRGQRSPLLFFSVDEIGRGRVTLNGDDVSSVIDGFTVQCRVGEPTRVWISIPGVVMDGTVAADDVRVEEYGAGGGDD